MASEAKNERMTSSSAQREDGSVKRCTVVDQCDLCTVQANAPIICFRLPKI